MSKSLQDLLLCQVQHDLELALREIEKLRTDLMKQTMRILELNTELSRLEEQPPLPEYDPNPYNGFDWK